MNVFIIVNALPVNVKGGSEVQSQEIAKRLAERGHTVTVYTRGFKDSPRKENIFGFEVLRAPFKPLIPLGVFTLNGIYQIVKRRREIDVILCWGLYPSALAVLAKSLTGTPAVFYTASEADYGCKGFFRKIFTALTVRYSSAVWVQSELARREFFRRLSKEELFIANNGVEVDGRVAKGDKIIYVGSLYETEKKDKGVKYLIEAMRHLSGRELLIIGDGPERGKLAAQAKGLPVKFLGNLEHARVKEHLLSSAVFAFPSIYGEGLPNTVLEALSVGLPVVASKTAKVDDIIRDGETGFLADPRDSQQFASRIREILEDKELRKKMSVNCLKEAEKYSWEKVIPHMTDLLEGAR